MLSLQYQTIPINPDDVLHQCKANSSSFDDPSTLVQDFEPMDTEPDELEPDNFGNDVQMPTAKIRVFTGAYPQQEAFDHHENSDNDDEDDEFIDNHPGLGNFIQQEENFRDDRREQDRNLGNPVGVYFF